MNRAFVTIEHNNYRQVNLGTKNKINIRTEEK